MLDQISVVIITRNAAATLADTLESTRRFSEVLVYDNGSDDATRQIARAYENVALREGEFMGFGPTKNHAVSLARHDWVLSLDADEVVSPELTGFLEQWRPGSDSAVGVIRRDNYLMGKLVDKGGWGSDWLVRLFNRNEHRFNDNAVHESVPTTATSDPEKISYPIRHNAVQNIGQFLIKIDRYSEIRRQTRKKTFHPFVIVLRSLFAFFRSYVLKGGFLAGWRGLVIAWSESNGVFYKYMMVYADRHP
ncbi:MAG: glycosyltransferase family 2 protein [Gammaproteobacteria bacterium]|nr:glycosyltransferase family 2 protein [Gammaproteobacteria bacterium]